jgi:hypothetical protein
MKDRENGVYIEREHVHRSRTVQEGKGCRGSANASANKKSVPASNK